MRRDCCGPDCLRTTWFGVGRKGLHRSWIADVRQRSDGGAVSVPFKGKVNVDIRDSVEDWSPFVPPQAPAGAPNVVYIVLDDVGYSAMSCYGGPIKKPNNRKKRSE